MLVVVLAVLLMVGGAATLFMVRSRRTPADDTTISSADRIEGSVNPPDDREPTVPAVARAKVPTAREREPEPPADEPELPADEPRADLSEEDEIAAARFRPPGERSISRADPDVSANAETVPTVVVRHLEGQQLESGAAPIIEDAPTDVEAVVSALIERVRTSDDDMVSVVSEMIEQDLDTDQMEEVLTELVERDRSARAAREELTLSGPNVPQRPGRLSAFADMPEAQKRRVIIRVLCLLIARSEENEAVGDIDDRPEYTVMLPDDALAKALAEPTARDLWGEPETDARDAHLPARRRRLVRSRH